MSHELTILGLLIIGAGLVCKEIDLHEWKESIRNNRWRSRNRHKRK